MPPPSAFLGPASPTAARAHRSASVGFVSHFGQNREWNQLHDTKEWAALVEDGNARMSEASQRAHFVSFFSSKHTLRNFPPNNIPLLEVMQVMRHGLFKQAHAQIWYRLFRSLRLRCRFQAFSRAYFSRAKQEREAVLDGWLEFWRAAERRAAADLRKQIQVAKPTDPRQSGRTTLLHAMVVTPDPLKVDVLWQLYWLLRSIFSQQTQAHWDQWLWLIHRRRELKQQPPPAANTLTLDFTAGTPQTLRAVNAAFFLQMLRRPRMAYPKGKDVTFKEMVRLANANNALPEWAAVPATAAVSSAMAGFLTSPLCADPEWMAFRLGQPSPLIPKRSWVPLPSKGPMAPLPLSRAALETPSDADPFSSPRSMAPGAPLPALPPRQPSPRFLTPQHSPERRPPSVGSLSPNTACRSPSPRASNRNPSPRANSRNPSPRVMGRNPSPAPPTQPPLQPSRPPDNAVPRSSTGFFTKSRLPPQRAPPRKSALPEVLRSSSEGFSDDCPGSPQLSPLLLPRLRTGSRTSNAFCPPL
eukprot:EG_transcript_3628